MAITQVNCPTCDTRIYASVSGEPGDIKTKECPRCGGDVPVAIDDIARSDIDENKQADSKRTGASADERFNAIVSQHSQDVDDVVAEIREAYQIEMQKIEAQSDIPTLEHVKEDIDDALQYIEEDTETMKNIMTVGKRRSQQQGSSESASSGSRTLRQRARNFVDSKIVTTIASRYLDGDEDEARAVYGLCNNLLQRYGTGSITRDNLLNEALAMELDDYQMQAVYHLLESGKFGEIIALLRN